MGRVRGLAHEGLDPSETRRQVHELERFHGPRRLFLPGIDLEGDHAPEP